MIIETPEPFIGFIPDIIEHFKEMEDRMEELETKLNKLDI